LSVARSERALAKRVARVEMFRTVGQQSFELFPSLPIELRLKIWSLVETPYDEPRVHSIRGFPYALLDSKQVAPGRLLEDNPDVRYISRWEGEPEGHFDHVVFLSPHGIHPVLHVCRESRYYTLKTFDFTFEFETYISFSRDTIFLDSLKGITYEEYCDSGMQSVDEMMKRNLAKSKVTSLAINAFEEEERAVFDKVLAMFKAGLPKLKELILVETDYREFNDTDGNAIARD
jgi:hypothetical protein